MTAAALERLDAIARTAGVAILEYYGQDGAPVEHKADRSPLTAADKAAHEIIVNALRAWTPAIPVVSEEGEVPPFAERRTWERFWLVDPLDGTKEFLQRNGEFTVNIALIEGDRPVLGVVYAPALNLCYTAGLGLGAWKRPGPPPCPAKRITSAPVAPGTPLVVAESRSHPSAELEAFLKTVPVARRVQAGSSLKFCWVAEGAADLYPRFGPTMEWDTAAGDCVFRNSGRDAPRRSPLAYNTAALRHDNFVIGDR